MPGTPPEPDGVADEALLQKAKQDGDVTIARQIWLRTTSSTALTDIENVYRVRLGIAASHAVPSTVAAAADRGREAAPSRSTNEEDVSLIWNRFYLLLAQSGRDDELAKFLRRRDIQARLARRVLNYPDAPELPPQLGDGSPALPCAVVDGAMSPWATEALWDTFGESTMPYWTMHDYSVEPPSRYFSFVLPLLDSTAPVGARQADNCPSKTTAAGANSCLEWWRTTSNGVGNPLGALGELVRAVVRAAVEAGYVDERDPDRCPRFAELWAHNRPHATGHQMHFDSDDEGAGGVRNPLAGSIYYLSSSPCGGPSLVTDQAFGATAMATQGWLCWPKRNRLMVFDGRMLHGVVPGKGVLPPD